MAKYTLLDNLGLKAFSIAIAIAIWLFVVVEKQPEVGLIVPVNFSNIPKNMALIKGNHQDIEIRVKGPQSLLSNLTSRQLEVNIDLSEVREGETTFFISPDNISIPRGIRVVRVLPSQVKATIEPIVERLISIEPVLLGIPAEGYELKEVKVFPETIKVRGAKSKVEELTVARTNSLNISGMDKSLTKTVELMPLGEHITLTEKPKIELRAIIQEKTEDKTLTSVPIKVLPITQGAVIEPQTVKLLLNGPLSKIRSLDASQVAASVNVQELKPGEDELTVNIQIPSSITLIEVIPSKVKVIHRGEEDKLLRPQIGGELLPVKPTDQDSVTEGKDAKAKEEPPDEK
jgi:YbbR domain-containing protein